MKPSSDVPVLVNQSYANQRVTGQQRYATEISRRLLSDGSFVATAPPSWWASSTLRIWAWVQFVLPFAARKSRLLSMTSRAPLMHPRQYLVIHDLFVLTNPEWFSRKYVLTHAPLLRFQLSRAAAVIAVSAPVAEQVRQMFSGPIVVAPNAPSEVFAVPPTATDDDAITSRGLIPGGYLLAVGSMDPRKNLRVLAVAYSQLSPTEREALPLVIVGGGSSVFRDASVSWPTGAVSAGFVSDDELRALYRHSRAVVFVSLAEGFGLPLVEAVSAGARSLIISDIPVFRWICGDGATYVDPRSSTDIARAFHEIDSVPIASNLDLSRFSWDDSTRVIRSLLIPDDQEVSDASFRPH